MSEPKARLRLAMFAPLPPARSGIADYVRDLLPLLPEDWDIDLYTDPVPGTPALHGAPILPAAEWMQQAAGSPYDLHVYHLGNAVEQEWTVRRALEQPGLVVLHDAVLHPARASARLGAADAAGYRAATAAVNDGDALAHLVAGGLASPALFWTFPLCEDVVRASRLTVVHGELLARWLQALVPAGRIGAVGHWRAVAETDPVAIRRWRARLDCGDQPLIGAFGNAGTAHGLDSLVRGLAMLPADGQWRAVIVGAVDAGIDLARCIADAGLSDRIRCTGAVDDDDFAALLRAVDFAVNLRYPTARASSGTLQQLLTLGVPVAVTDLLHLRDLPDAAVARIPPTDEAATALATALQRWLTDPAAAATARDAARAWAEAEITPESMAASYRTAVARAIGGGPGEGVVPCA